MFSWFHDSSSCGKEGVLAVDVGVLKEHKRFPGDKVRWIPDAEWALNKLKGHFKLYIICHVDPHEEPRLREELRGSFVVKYIPEERWFFVYERHDKVDVMK